MVDGRGVRNACDVRTDTIVYCIAMDGEMSRYTYHIESYIILSNHQSNKVVISILGHVFSSLHSVTRCWKLGSKEDCVLEI